MLTFCAQALQRYAHKNAAYRALIAHNGELQMPINSRLSNKVKLVNETGSRISRIATAAVMCLGLSTGASADASISGDAIRSDGALDSKPILGQVGSLAGSVEVVVSPAKARSNLAFQQSPASAPTVVANTGVDSPVVTSPTVPISAPALTGFRTGVGIHIGPAFNRPDIYWSLFSQTKVSSFRTDIRWSWIEKERGVYAIDRSLYYVDALLKEAAGRGIEPLIVLAYGNALYGGGLPVTEDAQTAFADYAAFVARHYKGYVRRYEVWNEWNIGMGATPMVKGSASAYARLLQKVYTALKAVDSEIIVLGGGAAGQDLSFPQRVLAAGGGAYMDGYSVHPYNLPDKPEQVFEFLGKLETVLMNGSGGKSVPIYVTEIGWTTASNADGVSELLQADYLARVYLLAPMRDYIHAVWWYDVQNDGWDTKKTHLNFGLFTYGFSPKPSQCAMLEVNQLVSKYQPVSTSRNGAGMWTAKYTNGSEFVFAVWNEDPNVILNVNVFSASPAGAKVKGRRICDASVSGNGDTMLQATISSTPMLFTTQAENLLVQ